MKAFFYLTGVVHLWKDAMWWFIHLESNLSNSKKKVYLESYREQFET